MSTGNILGRLAACDAKAAARGATVDLVCVARAGTAFARVWSRAEKRGGCATTGDQTAIGDRIDAHDADLRTRLVASGTASKCTAIKFRQAGRSARCRLACTAKAAKAGVELTDPRSVACLDACVAALSKGFARAEARGDCRTTGDTAKIDSATGAFVACIASLVGPSGSTPCSSVTTNPGSSTTSTTHGTSTSTSMSTTSAPTTTTIGGATTTTVTTSTTSTTGAPAMIQCCVPGSSEGAFVAANDPPGSSGGAFVCVVQSAADCTTAGGLDMGAGTCVPDPCPTTSSTIAPTTTSTVAASTTTSSSTTTTVTLLPCGGISPVCLGACPPGETCTPGNLLDPCSCVPDATTATIATTTTTTLIPCGILVGPLCSVGACPPGMTCTGAALTACSCQ